MKSRSKRLLFSAVFVATACLQTTVLQAQHSAAVVPGSTASWAGSNRYGGALAVDGAYGAAYPGANNFSNPNYNNFGMIGAMTGVGGGSNSTAGGGIAPYNGLYNGSWGGFQNRSMFNPTMMLMELMLGEGDFTSRLLQMTIQMTLMRTLMGGGAGANPFAAVLYGASSYAGGYSGTQSQGSNLLSTRPKSSADSSDPRLNICATQKLQGPTQAVSDLNKDLLRILY